MSRIDLFAWLNSVAFLTDNLPIIIKLLENDTLPY